MTPRVAPFAAYLAFILLTEALGWVGARQDLVVLWLYPVKTAVVLAVLLYYWRQYDELRLSALPPAHVAGSVATGVLVYVLWVRLDMSWAVQGQPEGYNPFEAGPAWGGVLAGMRLFGAGVVVPVMEELFWRSFLLRYLISPRFETVPLGTFTPLSFLVSLLLFGVEHHQWFAGIVAGAAYTGLLYYTTHLGQPAASGQQGRLWLCILAHAVTNLLLGAHVLLTEQWHWW